MHRFRLIGLLFIIISTLFVSNLTADAAKRQELESQFRTDTDFTGDITWWTDDTMKELNGYFPDMQVTYEDEEDYIDGIMEDIFASLVPYTGLQESDFFGADAGYDVYTYGQKLNGKYIDGAGFVKIELNADEELTITMNTLLNVEAPKEPAITEEQAYDIYKKICDPGDQVANMDEAYLRQAYILPSSDIDINQQKPTSLLLVWRADGGMIYKYYINAMTGELIKKVRK